MEPDIFDLFVSEELQSVELYHEFRNTLWLCTYYSAVLFFFLRGLALIIILHLCVFS